MYMPFVQGLYMPVGMWRRSALHGQTGGKDVAALEVVSFDSNNKINN